MSARARARADARFFFPPGLAPVAGFPSFLPFFSPLVLPTLRPTPLPTPPTSAKASRALWLRSVWTFRGADGGSRGTPTQSGDLCRVYSRLKVTRWVCSCPLPPSPHPPPRPPATLAADCPTGPLLRDFHVRSFISQLQHTLAAPARMNNGNNVERIAI